MGFDGYDWKDSNEVCEESSRFSRGNRKAYHMIKVAAHKEGKTLHEKLREMGTTGIQGPTFYNYDTGKLLGTVRLHDTTVTQEQMVSCGRMFCTTQSDEHVHLYVVDVTGMDELELDLEEGEVRYQHANEWQPYTDNLLDLEDPRFVVAMARYNR